MYDLLVPYFFDVMSLKSKTIQGPGLPSATGSYDFGGGAYGLWGQHDEQPNYPCTDATVCPQTKTVTVTHPDGSKKLETYGVVYQLNDGRLLQTQIENASSQVASTTNYTYMPDNDVASQQFYGRYGDVYGGIGDPTTAFVHPVTQTVLTQDGTTFTTHNNTFDSFARVTDKTESNTTGASRDVATVYHDNTDLWVLGQVHTATIDGTEASETTYDSATAQPKDIYRFGRFAWHRMWNTDGTLNSLTDGNQNTTTFTQWKRGTPRHVQYADGTTASAVVSDAGWVTAITDENSHTTGYQHDNVGRLIQITPPTDPGQNWQDTGITFAPMAQNELGIPGGHWTQVVTTGDDKTVTYYDGLWRPLVTEHFDSSDKTATLSQAATRYDAMGRTAFQSYPTNTITNVAAANTGSHRYYDALGRLTSVKQNSELGLLTTGITYPSGTQIQVTDPKNHITTTTYQAFAKPSNGSGNGKPVKVVFGPVATPQTTTTTVARDSVGAPAAMTQSGTWTPPGQSSPQAISVTHSFGYNTYHQLCLQTSPETGTTAFGYDAAGNPKWRAQGLDPTSICPIEANIPAGAKITRSYDDRNRLTAIDYPSGTADKHFTYYNDGKLETASRDASGNHPASTWTLDYYNRGLLQTETLAIDNKAFPLTHAYNSEGHAISLKYPSNRTIDYAPNGIGQPTALGTYATAIKYAPNGQVKSLLYDNGIHASFATNTRDLRSHTTYSLLGPDLTDRSLTYDKNGNLAAISDAVDGSTSSTGCATNDTIFCNGFDGQVTSSYAGTGNRSFQYDALDRLTNIVFSGDGNNGNDGYTYDPLGNVRTASYNAATYYYDATHNRLSSVNDVNGTTSYGHDTRGNVTSIGTHSVTRNRANELVGDFNNTSYAYDARGWRVEEKVTAGGSHTRYFIYDSAHRLMARIDNGTETDFITLGSKPIARIEGSTPTYIQDNRQHSPLFETNSADTITRAPMYLAYGRTDATGIAEIPGYTGAAPDKETGLLYLGARYKYGPRFLSPDPAGLDPTSPTGLNRFVYAGDNPANKIDPTGMFTCKDTGSCDAGQAIVSGLKKAQLHFKSGSHAYKSLAAGINALGTKNDGGAIQVIAKSDPNDPAVGRGAYDEKTGKQTLTINIAQLNPSSYKAKQNAAEFTATGRHELQHIINDVAAGHKPHNVSSEFWHEVRGVPAETPVWQGLGVDDPLRTWTSKSGLNMQNVYKEAQWSTNNYCPGGTCP